MVIFQWKNFLLQKAKPAKGPFIFLKQTNIKVINHFFKQNNSNHIKK